MTSTSTGQATAGSDDDLVVDRGTVEDLAAALGIVQDWLLHTDDDVLADLGEFAFSCHGRDRAVTGFVDELGTCGVRLHALLRGTADRRI
jgi:hypothetical protein